MQQRHYTSTLYFISIVILITLAIQVYWNYKNYQSGKVQLLRDVQSSLDNAVEKYYSDIAKHNTVHFSGIHSESTSLFKNPNLTSLNKEINNGKLKVKSISIKNEEQLSGINEKVYIDDIINTPSTETPIDSYYTKSFKSSDVIDSLKKSFSVSGPDKKMVDSLFEKMQSSSSTITDSIDILNLRDSAIKDLTSKIIISLDTSVFNIQTVDSLFKNQLKVQNLQSINHNLDFKTRSQKDTLTKNTNLVVKSTSSLLPEGDSLTVHFKNIAGIVLKRNLIGILLSTLLLFAVIASLLYLLRIINAQKQLATIKNDFISNITHEFNTPLATINAAVEGLLHFNTDNDPVKTEKYLQTSKNQVGKLQKMVQHILEISTLNRGELIINNEKTDINILFKKLIDRYKMISPENDIYLTASQESISISIDTFHFENAIDNILENALKYGKAPINIEIETKKDLLTIVIKDKGCELTKSQAKHIFEQFYRVPKGNTHDVKGFGIGLYYSKTIINKHNGSINVTTQPTTFKITMPYV